MAVMKVTLHHEESIFKSEEYPILSTSATIFDGMALVQSLQNNLAVVHPSAGTNADVMWAGFAIGTIALATTAPSIESFTVPSSSPYTITSNFLPITPTTNTAVWVDDGSGTAYAYTTDYTVSASVWTFDVSHAGAKVLISYQYALTAQQAELLFGDSYTLGAVTPSARTGTVGSIDEGIIFTTYFDPAVNWNALVSPVIKTGAGGVATIGGNGMTIPGASVWSAPTVNYPWLGIKI